jgi:hypothetical protein
MVGFVRIQTEGDCLDFDSSVDPLDRTRLHPDLYILAKKLAKDALDDECPHTEWIPRILKAPYKLKVKQKFYKFFEKLIKGSRSGRLFSSFSCC